MRVRLLGEMSGTRDGQEWPPRGSIIDLPDDEGLTLVRGGMAREVASGDVPPPVEAAVLTTDAFKAVVPTTPAASPGAVPAAIPETPVPSTPRRGRPPGSRNGG